MDNNANFRNCKTPYLAMIMTFNFLQEVGLTPVPSFFVDLQEI